ncbi:MAG: flavodoxin domain-containing protein [Defluviitaleaceae bacterium]|nr:flavodoxin domain-containing protein [Defluviitaleaceae bacterium]
MKKIAVIYKSKYGYTQRYAQWIAEALDAQLYEHTAIKPQQLEDYDVVVYGGGLYAGGINGAKLVTKNPCKNLVMFTVGVAIPADTDYTEIVNNALTPAQQAQTKVFHLRGGISYSKLSFLHKMLMAAVKKSVEKKPEAERSTEDIGILETYGQDIDFNDRTSIMPLVEYVQNLPPQQ